jgi:hypothetical protein
MAWAVFELRAREERSEAVVAYRGIGLSAGGARLRTECGLSEAC